MARKSTVSRDYLTLAPSDPAWQRFRWALTAIWAGSQSQMAVDLGVSQPLISRVTRGLQQPGSRLLRALAKQPALSRTWALTGAGEPHCAANDRLAELPISTEPLPGPPGRYRNRLSGERLAVANTEARDSRYFLRVDLAQGFSEGFNAGDLLLLETDARFWRKDLEFLNGRICLFRTSRSEITIVRASLVSADSGSKVIRFARLIETKGTSERESNGFDVDYWKMSRGMTLKGSTLPPIKRARRRSSNLRGTVLAVALELRRFL